MCVCVCVCVKKKMPEVDGTHRAAGMEATGSRTIPSPQHAARPHISFELRCPFHGVSETEGLVRCTPCEADNYYVQAPKFTKWCV